MFHLGMDVAKAKLDCCLLLLQHLHILGQLADADAHAKAAAPLPSKDIDLAFLSDGGILDLHSSQKLKLHMEQCHICSHICRVDKRSASTMPTSVDALRLSTLRLGQPVFFCENEFAGN